MVFPIRAIQLMDSRFGSEYASPNGLLAIDELYAKVPHCNYLYLDAYIDVNATYSTATRRTTGSNSEANLAAAIAEARKCGLKIIIRMRVSGSNTFIPSDATLFWTNYGKAAADWAAWAQALNVELFGISNELDKLVADSAGFNVVITAVRAVYQGRIYATLSWPNSPATLQTMISATWLNNLDLIMLSAYNELISSTLYSGNGIFSTANPTVAQLVAGWHSYPNWGADPKNSYKGTDIPLAYRKVATAHNKQVVFNCGIASYHGSPSSPWTGAGTPVDLQIQDLVYQAFFEVFGHEYWVDGWMLDGGWLTTPLANMGTPQGTFTIQNKPAMATVENGFAGLTPAPPPPITCPTGQHLDPTTNTCIPDIVPPPAPVKSLAARSIGPFGLPAAVVHLLWLARERLIKPEVHKKLHPLV
jgi:hypothetical protein